jgi:hypothetical protein
MESDWKLVRKLGWMDRGGFEILPLLQGFIAIQFPRRDDVLWG